MNSAEFLRIRKIFGATQKQMAEMLGMSLKAVHSYEQGWRSIPTHVERQLLFLLFLKRHEKQKEAPCWEIKSCPPERKENCPAWKFHAGNFCWFINGTLCECKAKKSWQEKMDTCRNCEVLSHLLDEV